MLMSASYTSERGKPAGILPNSVSWPSGRVGGWDATPWDRPGCHWHPGAGLRSCLIASTITLHNAFNLPFLCLFNAFNLPFLCPSFPLLYFPILSFIVLTFVVGCGCWWSVGGVVVVVVVVVVVCV